MNPFAYRPTSHVPWRSTLLFCALLSWLVLDAAAAQRPSVVIFLADDSGWGDYSHSGNTQVRTPNIDSSARDGAALDRFLFARFAHPHEPSFSRAGITLAAACVAYRQDRNV